MEILAPIIEIVHDGQGQRDEVEQVVTELVQNGTDPTDITIMFHPKTGACWIYAYVEMTDEEGSYDV